MRIAKLAPYLGILLLVAAAGGPAAWPWYFTWGLVLLAGSPGLQDSRPLALGVVVAVFVIKPNGILALPVQSSPGVVYACWGAWLAVAIGAWRHASGRPRPPAPTRRHQAARPAATSPPREPDLTRA